MYLFERLSGEFTCEIVPGVSSLMASAAALQRPLAARNDVLTVVPAPVDDDTFLARVGSGDAIAIIKIGRHFERLCGLIESCGLIGRAVYLERVSLAEQKLMPLRAMVGKKAPYFSMVLIYKGGEAWIEKLPVPAFEDVPENEIETV